MKNDLSLCRPVGLALKGAAAFALLGSSCSPNYSPEGDTAYDRTIERDAYYEDAAQARTEQFSRRLTSGPSLMEPVDERMLKSLAHPPPY